MASCFSNRNQTRGSEDRGFQIATLNECQLATIPRLAKHADLFDPSVVPYNFPLVEHIFFRGPADVVDHHQLATLPILVAQHSYVVETVREFPPDNISWSPSVQAQSLLISRKIDRLVGHPAMIDVCVQLLDSRIGCSVGLGIVVNELLQIKTSVSERSDDNVGANSL